MKSTDAIREIMKKEGVTLAELSRRTGKSRQATYGRLTQDSISISLIQELAKAMGYKIVLMSSDEEIRDGWYEIDDNRKE